MPSLQYCFIFFLKDEEDACCINECQRDIYLIPSWESVYVGLAVGLDNGFFLFDLFVGYLCVGCFE